MRTRVRFSPSTESPEMTPRTDSLFARLKRDGNLDEFFAFVATEAPGFRDMLAWMEERGIAASMGAVHNLVTYHMGVWRAQQAVAAADQEMASLPADADEKLRERIRMLKFDLTMRDLSVQQQLAVWKLDQTERDLAEKARNAREVAVDALLKEAEGNPAAKAALAAFLSALDSPHSERGTEQASRPVAPEAGTESGASRKAVPE